MSLFPKKKKKKKVEYPFKAAANLSMHLDDAMRNINGCTLTNERTLLLTCDLHKQILACFEMFPCESEPNKEEAAT